MNFRYLKGEVIASINLLHQDLETFGVDSYGSVFCIGVDLYGDAFGI